MLGEKKDTDMDGFLTFEEFKQGRNETFLQNAEEAFSCTRYESRQQSFT